MPFPPEDFYSAAKLLGENKPPAGESRYRTAAGRAYYAAWLATREAIRARHGLDDKYNPGHEQLANGLAADQVDAELRRLGNLLNTLRLKRVHADYRLAKPLLEDHADDSIAEAREVLDLLPGVQARLPCLPTIHSQ